MSEEPRCAVPASGAMWFPDEGGIMWRGKAYFPEDYVFTRNDIKRVKAEAWGEGYSEGALYGYSPMSDNIHNPYKGRGHD